MLLGSDDPQAAPLAGIWSQPLFVQGRLSILRVLRSSKHTGIVLEHSQLERARQCRNPFGQAGKSLSPSIVRQIDELFRPKTGGGVPHNWHWHGSYMISKGLIYMDHAARSALPALPGCGATRRCSNVPLIQASNAGRGPPSDSGPCHPLCMRLACSHPCATPSFSLAAAGRKHHAQGRSLVRVRKRQLPWRLMGALLQANQAAARITCAGALGAAARRLRRAPRGPAAAPAAAGRPRLRGWP